MRQIIALICAWFVALVLQGCTVIGNPYKSTEAMRQDLLKFTPVGSSMAEVEQKLKKKHFEMRRFPNHGFLRRSDNKVIGRISIEAPLASYRSGVLASASIVGFWGFDSDEKLIDIWVWKVVDSL